MKIFCHASHWYEDHAHHVLYKFGPDSLYDVDAETAVYMLTAHPDKFCRIDEDASAIHSCGRVPTITATVPADYQHRELQTPPEDREMVLTRRVRQRKPR